VLRERRCEPIEWLPELQYGDDHDRVDDVVEWNGVHRGAM